MRIFNRTASIETDEFVHVSTEMQGHKRKLSEREKKLEFLITTRSRKCTLRKTLCGLSAQQTISRTTEMAILSGISARWGHYGKPICWILRYSN